MQKIYWSPMEAPMTSEYLLSKVMTTCLGLPEDTRVSRPKGGKPSLPDHPDIFFSVTHTGGYWLCVVSDHEVGLDAEFADRKVNNPDRLAHRFLSDGEMDFIREVETEGLNGDRTPEEVKSRTFIMIWTWKESYAKLSGSGLAADLKSLCTATAEDAMFSHPFIPVKGLYVTLCGYINEADLLTECEKLDL